MKSKVPIKVFIHCRKSIPRQIKIILKNSALLTIKSLPPSVLRRMTRGLKQGHLTIALVSPKRIQKLNNQYRGKAKPTDVLSFSRIENVPFSPIQDEDIGDVLICWEVAKKQARIYQTTLSEEIARLTVHGVLHLFGYDHERSRKDEKTMFALQNKILRNLAKSI